jgi:hypothetical protein
MFYTRFYIQAVLYILQAVLYTSGFIYSTDGFIYKRFYIFHRRFCMQAVFGLCKVRLTLIRNLGKKALLIINIINTILDYY